MHTHARAHLQYTRSCIAVHVFWCTVLPPIIYLMVFYMQAQIALQMQTRAAVTVPITHTRAQTQPQSQVQTQPQTQTQGSHTQIQGLVLLPMHTHKTRKFMYKNTFLHIAR